MSEYIKINEKLDLILDKVGTLENEMTGLKTDVSELKTDVTKIKIKLENETDHNIRVIAENHLDLNRKLEEVLKDRHEREIFMIRLNYLEGDVKRIKEKVFANA